MELLLTTPLTSKYILWGKLRGLVSFALPLLFGPVLVLLLFAIYAMTKHEAGATLWIESVVELGALLIIYTAFGCVVGLWRSLNSKTNVAAVMHSLAVLILACGVASLIGFSVVEAGSGAFGAFLAAFTPFTPVPRADQVVPSHAAMRLAGTSTTFSKEPPMISRPLYTTAE